MAINRGAPIRLHQAADTGRWLEAARKHAETEAGRVEPYLAVPILLQLYDDYYFGRDRQEPLWLGRGLKIALALVARNLYFRRALSLSRK